jgi:hypothetical protein
MAGSIEVGAHMVGGLDILSIDTMLRFSLKVFHLKGWVKRPE